jgi:mono/diheme cytochrome c family protein
MQWRKWINPVLIAVGGSSLSAQQAPRIKPATPENISPANEPEMFRAYCSVCHGTGGLRDEPAAPALKKQLADLTQLTRKNNGKFPVYRIANGVQGVDVSASTVRGNGGLGHCVPGSGANTVKPRIDNLTSYLESLATSVRGKL